ncbi:MAG TPA: hypothetical protein P5080_03710 [Candidatus Paceibacterota bacterium]|nr:hypothetical protein [Candidatus Pacearchaeota archaeon]HRZ51050.1 hypothetical protein [Candidatus Paceibacterota bacterium]HSA36791.1 hypothetical protein [Candidatus Paceibacterota bacterium]
MMLEKGKRYLQIALNGTIEDARLVAASLPRSKNILLEAGTPLIKEYGIQAIAAIRQLDPNAYIVADIKCADLADREIGLVCDIQPAPIPVLPKPLLTQKITFLDLIKMTADQINAIQETNQANLSFPAIASDANAATVLGVAPVETINLFIEECKKRRIDSMVDMMNVPNPLSILKKLDCPPDAVILHRGVDETEFSREKQIPYYQIKQIKGNYDILVAVAGGDTIREIQRAFFNDADIVVVWKNFYQATEDTARLAQDFLKEI